MLVAASAALAVTMLMINIAFEVAGSVPDIDGCGFLAGPLVVLLVLYPLAAGMVGARAAERLLRRFPDARDEVVRMGCRVGIGGAALYFGLGLSGAQMSPHTGTLAPGMWPALALYSVVITLAARQGAQSVISS